MLNVSMAEIREALTGASLLGGVSRGLSWNSGTRGSDAARVSQSGDVERGKVN